MLCFRTTPEGATSKPPVLQHAFTSPTADVILRSSDDVDFRVHKLILSEASTAFEGMFSVPQPISPSTPNKGDLPVVRMAETAETLNALLGVLYPGRGSQLFDLSVVGEVLIAAEKYGMSGVLKQMEHVLLQRDIVEKEPMKVYALACHCGMQRAAAAAAKETLLHPMPGSHIPEFSLMSGSAFYSLVQYRRTCVDLIYPLLNGYGNYQAVWKADHAAPRYSVNSEFNSMGLTCAVNHHRRQNFEGHLYRVKERYASRVCGSSIMSPDLWFECVSNLMECEKCSREFPPQLTEFNERLATILDSRIVGVSTIAFASITRSYFLLKYHQVKLTFRC